MRGPLFRPLAAGYGVPGIGGVAKGLGTREGVGSSPAVRVSSFLGHSTAALVRQVDTGIF